MSTQDYPQKAVEAALAAIVDTDERTRSGRWTWAGMPRERKLSVLTAFIGAMTAVEADDFLADCCMNASRTIWLNPELIWRRAIQVATPVMESLEDQVNQRSAA